MATQTWEWMTVHYEFRMMNGGCAEEGQADFGTIQRNAESWCKEHLGQKLMIMVHWAWPSMACWHVYATVTTDD